MTENTKIEWADNTFNYVWGCTKISVGPQGACEKCYAETWAKRTGHSVWGADGAQRDFPCMCALKIIALWMDRYGANFRGTYDPN